MTCDFHPIDARRSRCTRCGGTALTARLPTGECPGSTPRAEHAAGPGARLTSLLAEIGIAYEPGCHCGPAAAKLDADPTQIDETVAVMRAEADNRGLWFVESQARWLVELAIKLAAENREPTRLERLRLRAMRIAVNATHRCGRLK